MYLSRGDAAGRVGYSAGAAADEISCISFTAICAIAKRCCKADRLRRGFAHRPSHRPNHLIATSPSNGVIFM
ncbi:hypothetical protein [Nodularia spumigena]|uniref:hypothetical protein n=1 Tax=Nodularia spumigena TaxID=70799 RepID=UPI002B220C4A|nr:hypothetical protein [Nodularia spumigena]MEA5527775.1 hypothetical protein [Nodularia spumigena UHCC 0143]